VFWREEVVAGRPSDEGFGGAERQPGVEGCGSVFCSNFLLSTIAGPRLVIVDAANATHTTDCLAGVEERICVAELEGKRAAKKRSVSKGTNGFARMTKTGRRRNLRAGFEEESDAAEKAVFER
jgi:hypothetical protein